MTQALELPSPSRLVSEGMRVLRARFWVLLGALGAGTVAAGLGVAVPLLAMAAWQLGGSPPLWAWAVVWVVTLSAALWLGSWAQVALFEAALAEDAPVREILRRSWPKIGPFSWACILYMFFVGGGLMLFILPGLYLAVALSFAPLISLEEGVTGLEACRRSLRYARGRWGGVAGRLALVAAFSLLPSLVPLVGWIVGGFIAPLPVVMLCLLYRGARETSAEEGSSWPLALGLAGWIPGLWMTAAAVSQVRALWPQLQGQVRQAARNMDPVQAQNLLATLRSGDAGPQTALEMARLLQNAATGVTVSSAAATAPAPATAAPAEASPR